MAKTGYVKTVLTGGGASALDGISGAVLLDGDFAFVGVGNLAYFYILDADSAAAESSPDIIAPDTTPGNKRWILQNYLSSGFTGTSVTGLTIGTGAKTLTVETNKGFVVGMSVKIAYTTTPTTWMHGDITSYTSATGELIVTVGTTSGSGTQSVWTISLSSPTSIYASAAEILAGTEAAKAIAPDQFLSSNVRALLTAQGDILYASAANTLARLAKGTTLQTLRMNAAATAPEWAADDIPASTKMLFYADTAPTGWTLDNTLDDKVVFVTKGSAAGGQTGGGAHSTGTWTQPGHQHAHAAFTLTTNEMPAHTHTTETGGLIDRESGVGQCARNGTNQTASTGGGGSHTHPNAAAAATANTWRPAAYAMIICSKN